MLKTQNYKSKISLNVVSISSTSFCVNAENSFFRERIESFPFPCSKKPTIRESYYRASNLCKPIK